VPSLFRLINTFGDLWSGTLAGLETREIGRHPPRFRGRAGEGVKITLGVLEPKTEDGDRFLAHSSHYIQMAPVS